MHRFKKWAKREYPLRFRILALLPAGGLFVFLIPYVLIKLGPRLDLALRLPAAYLGLVNILAGALLIAIGLVYAYGSIGLQLFQAGGTPLPVMATHRLLATGVFKQCRNPMSFGTICLYLGISLLAGSISSLLIVAIFSALLMLYIKTIEERELALRFGEEYAAYKAVTPFIIPRVFFRYKSDRAK